MRRFGVAYRLSPNEETQILQNEKDRRRKLRIQQVREQERRFARLIREKVQAKKEQEIRILAGQLEQDWLESKLEKRELLEEVYKKTLETVGKAHDEAEQQPLYDEIRDRNRAINERKAKERGQQAIQKQLEENEQRIQEEFTQVMTRRTALEIERARAALIAKKPKGQSNTVPDESEPVLAEPTRVLHHEGFSTTHYTVQAAEYAEKAGPEEQGDAKEDAQREEERLAEEQQEKDREQKEREIKAALRQKHAQNRERLKRDHQRLQANLERMEQADRRRRQLIVSDIPKQIFQPPHRRLEEQEEDQKDMEQAFENMYMANTDYAGDIELALEVTKPPAEAALDVSSDTPGEEFQVPEPRRFPRGLDRAKTATTKNDTLKKLLQKVHSQRHDHIARQKAESRRGRVDTKKPPYVSPVEAATSTAGSSLDTSSTAASGTVGSSVASSSAAQSTDSPSVGLSSIRSAQATLSTGPIDSSESGESPAGVSSELSQHPVSSGSSQGNSSGQGSLETGSISESSGTTPSGSTLMHPLEEAQQLRRIQDQTRKSRQHHWNMEGGMMGQGGLEPLREEGTSPSPSPGISSSLSGITQGVRIGHPSEINAATGVPRSSENAHLPLQSQGSESTSDGGSERSHTGAAQPVLGHGPHEYPIPITQSDRPIWKGQPNVPICPSQLDGPIGALQQDRTISHDARFQWRDHAADARQRNVPKEPGTLGKEQQPDLAGQQRFSGDQKESADAVQHPQYTPAGSAVGRGGQMVIKQALGGQKAMVGRSPHTESPHRDGRVPQNGTTEEMGARQAAISHDDKRHHRDQLGGKRTLFVREGTEVTGSADVPPNYLDGLPASHLEAVGRRYPNIYEALTGGRPPPDVGGKGPSSPVISVSSGGDSSQDEGKSGIRKRPSPKIAPRNGPSKWPSPKVAPCGGPRFISHSGRDDGSRSDEEYQTGQGVMYARVNHPFTTPDSTSNEVLGPSADIGMKQASERSDKQGPDGELRALLRDYQEQLLALQTSNSAEIAGAQARLRERRQQLLRIYPQRQQQSTGQPGNDQTRHGGEHMSGLGENGQRNGSEARSRTPLDVDRGLVQLTENVPHIQQSEAQVVQPGSHYRQRAGVEVGATDKRQNVTGGKSLCDSYVNGGSVQLVGDVPQMQPSEDRSETSDRQVELGRGLGREHEGRQDITESRHAANMRFQQPSRGMPGVYLRGGREQMELERGRTGNGGGQESAGDSQEGPYVPGEGGEDRMEGGWVTAGRHKQRQSDERAGDLEQSSQPQQQEGRTVGQPSGGPGHYGMQRDMQQVRDGFSLEQRYIAPHMASMHQIPAEAPATSGHRASRKTDGRLSPDTLGDEVTPGSISERSVRQPGTSVFGPRSRSDFSSQQISFGPMYRSDPAGHPMPAASQWYLSPTLHQDDAGSDGRTLFQLTPPSLSQAAVKSTESTVQQESSREETSQSMYGDRIPSEAVLRRQREVDVSMRNDHLRHRQQMNWSSTEPQPWERWEQEGSPSPGVVWRPVRELHVAMPTVNIPDQSPLTDTSLHLSADNSPLPTTPPSNAGGEKQPKGLLTPRKLAQTLMDPAASPDVGSKMASGALAADHQISPSISNPPTTGELITPRMISGRSAVEAQRLHPQGGPPGGRQNQTSTGPPRGPTLLGSDPASPNHRNVLPEMSETQRDILPSLGHDQPFEGQQQIAMDRGAVLQTDIQPQRSPRLGDVQSRPTHQLGEVSASHLLDGHSRYMAEFTHSGMTPYHRADSAHLLPSQSLDRSLDRKTSSGDGIISDGQQNVRIEPEDCGASVTERSTVEGAFAVGTDNSAKGSSQQSSSQAPDPDSTDGKQANVEPTDRGLLEALKNLMITKARNKVPGVAAPSTNYFGHLDLLNPEARGEDTGGGQEDNRPALSIGGGTVHDQGMEAVGTRTAEAVRGAESECYNDRLASRMGDDPVLAQGMAGVGTNTAGAESERNRVHQRPPVASRSKLQVFQEMTPHELSTIIEVDSPLFETLPSSLSFTAGTDASSLSTERNQESTSTLDDGSSQDWGTPHRHTPSWKSSGLDSSHEIYIHQPTTVSALEEVPLGDGRDSLTEISGDGFLGSLTADSLLTTDGIVAGEVRLSRRSPSLEQRLDCSSGYIISDNTLSEGPLSTSIDSPESRTSNGRGSHLSGEPSEDASPFPMSAEVIKRRMPQLSFEGALPVTATDAGDSRSRDTVDETTRSVTGHSVLERSSSTASSNLPMNQLYSRDTSQTSTAPTMLSSSQDMARVERWDRQHVSDYTIPSAMGIRIEESASEQRLPGMPPSPVQGGEDESLEEGPLEDTIQEVPESSTGLEGGPLDDTLTGTLVYPHPTIGDDSTIGSSHSFRPLLEQRGSEEHHHHEESRPQESSSIQTSSGSSAVDMSVKTVGIKKKLSFVGSSLEEGPLESTREVSRYRDATSIAPFSVITASDGSSLRIASIHQIEPSHSGNNLASSKEEFRHGEGSGTPSYSAMSISSRLDFPPVASEHSGHSMDGAWNMRRLTPASAGSSTDISENIGHRRALHVASGLGEGPLESTRRELKARDVTSVPSFSAIAASENLHDHGHRSESDVGRSMSRENPLDSMRGASESSIPWYSEFSTSSRFDLPPVFSGGGVEPSTGERLVSPAAFATPEEEFRAPPNTRDSYSFSRSASIHRSSAVISESVHRDRTSNTDDGFSGGPTEYTKQASRAQVTRVDFLSASGRSGIHRPLSDRRMYAEAGLEEGPLESTRMEFVQRDITSIPSFSGISTAEKESHNGAHHYGRGRQVTVGQRMGSLDELLTASTQSTADRRQQPRTSGGQSFDGVTDEGRHELTDDRTKEASHHSRGSQETTEQTTGILEEPELTFQTTFDTNMTLDSDTGGGNTEEGEHSTPSDSLLSFMRHEEQLAHSTPRRAHGQEHHTPTGTDDRLAEPLTSADEQVATSTGMDGRSATTPSGGEEEFAHSGPIPTEIQPVGESSVDHLNTNTNAQDDSEPLSLQEALARHKAGFIKASQARRTEVKVPKESKVDPAAATAFSATLKNWQKAKLQAQQRSHRNKSGVVKSSQSNKENLGVQVKAVPPKTSQDRKGAQRADKERTKRLYNRLEEVKTKKMESDRKKAYAENRRKRKEYEEKLKQKRAVKNQQKK